MQHRTTRGKISYRDATGAERGREWFHITESPDGSRTMRTTSEIDDSEILRDVTLSLGADWRPRDCYVRISVADEMVGAGWFEFGEREARCTVESSSLGRLCQVVTTPGRPPMFGAHQVAGDGWQAALLHGCAPTVSKRVDGILLSSALPNGASGPMIATTSMVAELVGPERITVPAGTFDTMHYRFSPDGLDAEEVWVLVDGLVLVRSEWAAYQTTYELTELVQR